MFVNKEKCPLFECGFGPKDQHVYPFSILIFTGIVLRVLYKRDSIRLNVCQHFLINLQSIT